MTTGQDLKITDALNSRFLSCLSQVALKIHSKLISSTSFRDSTITYLQNSHGERQHDLDLFANELVLDVFKSIPEVVAVISEENESLVSMSDRVEKPSYVLAVDPLDGSSNLDVGLTVGTIFGVYEVECQTVLQTKHIVKSLTGRQLVFAGYVLYGTPIQIVWTCGNGVNYSMLSRDTGVLEQSAGPLIYPRQSLYYSVNEGNFEHFSFGVKSFINSIKAPERNLSCRYSGSLVADFHRNLLQGGIFLYPATTNKEKGKLRLLYECNPLSYIAEQAGGIAIDNTQNILDLVPHSYHQCTPFYVGPRETIEELQKYLAV